MRGIRGVVAAGAVVTGLIAVTGVAQAGIRVGAVDDLYETPFETPVTIDPLENDVVQDGMIVDGPFFITDPQNGTLDGLVYTPDAGFSGTDSFDYYFTWEWERAIDAPVLQQVIDPEDCDLETMCSVATVFVNVGAPPATTTTTTVAPTTTTTPTTVATQVVAPTTTTTQVAAQAELPRTGGGRTAAWAPFGAATLLLGLAAMRFGRRGNPRRV